jgi:hypothetical protein
MYLFLPWPVHKHIAEDVRGVLANQLYAASMWFFGIWASCCCPSLSVSYRFMWSPFCKFMNMRLEPMQKDCRNCIGRGRLNMFRFILFPFMLQFTVISNPVHFVSTNVKALRSTCAQNFTLFLQLHLSIPRCSTNAKCSTKVVSLT